MMQLKLSSLCLLLASGALAQELELTDVDPFDESVLTQGTDNQGAGAVGSGGATDGQGVDIVEDVRGPVPESALCNGLEIVNPGFGFGAQDFNLSCAETTILQNKGLDPNAYEQTAVQTDAPQARRIAVLRGLDKITGRITDLELPVGQAATFETLTIQAAACFKNPETETPESAAYLQVDDSLSGRSQRLFSGWMYASSPSLSAMESAIYDVWVVDCKN